MAKPRLLFCSYHSYLDPSSGAALATRDLLELLTSAGWPCAVLTGPDLDYEQGSSLESLLRAQNIPFQFRPGPAFGADCTLYHYVRNGVAVHLFGAADARPRQEPAPSAARAFLSLFEHVRQQFRPDLLLTYGGHAVARQLMAEAHRHGVRVVFALHNFAYADAELFRPVAGVLVPSQAAREHYQHTLGIDSTVLPGPWNWEQVRCPARQPQHVVFVNPQPAKGAFWFARIAHELGLRRPDISLLVVEGRGRADWLARTGLDLVKAGNLHWMANTPDPRDFYRLARLVLVPSLWQEALGRVVVEALINGIPVLASRSGGLPEALAGAGFLFDLPPRFHTSWTEVPTAEEVAPWIETIERLWDDTAFYERESQQCQQVAEAWRPQRLLPRFEAFFQGLLPRQGT
jgi:glycosyltransferase involved in cell wall biosynthesis